MYTLKEIAALRQKCKDLRLAGRRKLERYSDEELQYICNGIGPRGIPAFIRKSFNSLHPSLQAAAFIHDVEFEESDGTKKAFERANTRFLINGFRMAKFYYTWYDFRRYILRWQTRRLTALCRRFGWLCWSWAALNNQKGD